jgi:DNA-binding NarL/FixJ family response regulator
MGNETPQPNTAEVRKVLIVDDHPVVRRGLADLINQQQGLRVCADTGSAKDAFKAIAEHEPDLAIIDISLGKVSGLELIKQLKAQWPHLQMLALSMHDEKVYGERALRAGARGYVMKAEQPEHIIEAIRCVLDGKPYVSHAMSSRLIERLAGMRDPQDASLLDTLSDRELEVFELLGRGMTTGEIADTLFLSVKTVQSHRENLKKKLKLHNSAELLQRAVLWWQEQAGSA